MPHHAATCQWPRYSLSAAVRPRRVDRWIRLRALAVCLPLVRLTKALYLAAAEHLPELGSQIASLPPLPLTVVEHLLEPLQRCGDLLRAGIPWGAPLQHGHVPAALVSRRDVQRVWHPVLQAHRPSAVHHDSIRGVEQGGRG